MGAVMYLEEGGVGVVSDGVEQTTHRQLQCTHNTRTLTQQTHRRETCQDSPTQVGQNAHHTSERVPCTHSTSVTVNTAPAGPSW